MGKKAENSPVYFNAPTTNVDKLKTIAHLHGQNNSDVYNQAFAKFIELYEKKNGPVKIDAKKKNIKL